MASLITSVEGDFTFINCSFTREEKSTSNFGLLKKEEIYLKCPVFVITEWINYFRNCTFTGLTFIASSSDYYGGAAIYYNMASFSCYIYGCSFINCKTIDGCGGDLCFSGLSKAYFYLYKNADVCTNFEGCSSTFTNGGGRVGAIFFDPDGVTIFSIITISSNTAMYGKNIYLLHQNLNSRVNNITANNTLTISNYSDAMGSFTSYP